MLNKFLKLPTEQKALLVAAVVVILLGLFYHSYNYPQLYARMGAGVGRLQGSVNLEAMGEKCKVVLFHSTTCPHCVSLMPEWHKFKNNYSSKFDIKEIEGSEQSKSTEYKNVTITGVPTIMVFNENNKDGVTYDGSDRKAESIAKFANDMCTQ